MNGILVVDKPAGPTSHDVVARVRRAIGISRIGHTGTLDPLATGVLPLVVGRATRLAQFLSSDEKEYIAGIRFGLATATYDAQERLRLSETGDAASLLPLAAPPGLSAADVTAALPSFTGTYSQLPPPYSAKKVAGQRAYALARLSKDVELTPVAVTVRALELLDYSDGLARLRVACSSGFYVRSLAHDLGQRLGCGAHLESLRRIRAGEFREDRAVPLAVIQEERSAALGRMIPLGQVLSRLPQVVVNARGAKRAAHGNPLAAEDLSGADGMVATAVSPGPVRVLDGQGDLLAIGQPAPGGLLQPVVVLV